MNAGDPGARRAVAASVRRYAREDVIRAKAARRGRIRHTEGDRYEVPGWTDVIYLLDLIDALRLANGVKR